MMARHRTDIAGLSTAEAQARLASDGPNELPARDARNTFKIVIEVLREPMLLMLLAACGIYLALGDLHEAVLIVGLASASILITVVQEARSERVLGALRDLSNPRALVIRDGERRRVPSRDLVRGDVVVLTEGDRIPADASLLTIQPLGVDESLLTGESVAVRKSVEGGETDAALYSGTLIVSGSGPPG